MNDASPRRALWPTYAPPDEPVFVRGRGSFLYDEAGGRWLDFLSGIAVTSFGHAHPRLVAALTEQAGRLWHLSNVFRIPEAERLARRLAEHSFADRVYFANSGAEAVEAAIKAARLHQAESGRPGRRRVIGFADSFHGRTLGALAAAGNPAHTRHFLPLDTGFDQAPWDDIEALTGMIGPDTAAVIVEPVQGEGGIRPASAGFLRGLRELCDRDGLLLIFDEVQCGAGRTGRLFAHEHAGARPDIAALAKGLGGGFPVGACLATEEVGRLMGVGAHGSTFGGNPLAMAVANAALDLLLEPGLLDEVAHKGERLRAGLAGLAARHGELIGPVTGVGLMIGVGCAAPNAELMAALRGRGLLVGRSGGNAVRLLPPLNVADEEIDQALDIFAACLGDWPAA